MVLVKTEDGWISSRFIIRVWTNAKGQRMVTYWDGEKAASAVADPQSASDFVSVHRNGNLPI